jgi:hypothetical protein
MGATTDIDRFKELYRLASKLKSGPHAVLRVKDEQPKVQYSFIKEDGELCYGIKAGRKAAYQDIVSKNAVPASQPKGLQCRLLLTTSTDQVIEGKWTNEANLKKDSAVYLASTSFFNGGHDSFAELQRLIEEWNARQNEVPTMVMLWFEYHSRFYHSEVKIAFSDDQSEVYPTSTHVTLDFEGTYRDVVHVYSPSQKIVFLFDRTNDQHLHRLLDDEGIIKIVYNSSQAEINGVKGKVFDLGSHYSGIGLELAVQQVLGVHAVKLDAIHMIPWDFKLMKAGERPYHVLYAVSDALFIWDLFKKTNVSV